MFSYRSFIFVVTRRYEGGEAVVWPLTGALLSFKDGPLLRLRMLLTSVLPLRLYIHPLVHIHSGRIPDRKQVT